MPWPQLSDFTVYIWTCTGPGKVSTTRGARLDLTAGLYHVPRSTAWSINRTAPNGLSRADSVLISVQQLKEHQLHTNDTVLCQDYWCSWCNQCNQCNWCNQCNLVQYNRFLCTGTLITVSRLVYGLVHWCRCNLVQPVQPVQLIYLVHSKCSTNVTYQSEHQFCVLDWYTAWCNQCNRCNWCNWCNQCS